MNRHTTERPAGSGDRYLIDELTRDMPEHVREEYEERAAILEFDGGMTRECAEFASVALLLLRRSPASYGVLPARVGAGQGAGIGLTAGASPWADSGPSWADLAAALRALGGTAALVRPDADRDTPE
ncbi:hypothetical protein [Ideonella alba]|uniref:Uncharacterized protein n=1 Tax=Ideonella alba TaxID=2824118 RepID=A0A941BEI8_9BURK|nr:hypothetical protein [Ideonella alba]MBQ0931171.1 hypothetical protein [Ideonella alba]